MPNFLIKKACTGKTFIRKFVFIDYFCKKVSHLFIISLQTQLFAYCSLSVAHFQKFTKSRWINEINILLLQETLSDLNNAAKSRHYVISDNCLSVKLMRCSLHAFCVIKVVLFSKQLWCNFKARTFFVAQH